MVSADKFHFWVIGISIKYRLLLRVIITVPWGVRGDFWANSLSNTSFGRLQPEIGIQKIEYISL